MLSTLILTPRDDRGVEILDEMERETPAPFRWNDRTGARSYALRGDFAPPSWRDVLDRLDANWREHLEAHLT